MIFQGTVECPARKVYEHALGFAVVQYNALHIEGAVKSATFSQKILDADDKTTIYGLADLEPCAIETTVMKTGPLTGSYIPQQFYQPLNVDVLHLKTEQSCGSGILVDDEGAVQGLWLPFMTHPRCQYVGVPVSLFMREIETLQQGLLPEVCRMLDIELGKVPKIEARVFGVSEGRALPLPSGFSVG